MAYVLETITPADQQKIIKDAACDPSYQKLLIHVLQSPHEFFPGRWVIDRDRNFYMYITPTNVRPETSASPRSFFFKGRLYQISLTSQFGYEVEFVDKPPISELKEFQEELTAAFAVSGRGVGGPLNEFGTPEYAFVPAFKTEGGYKPWHSLLHKLNPR